MGRAELYLNDRLPDGSYALRMVNPGVHYHRYVVVGGTSNYDDGSRMQTMMERCKCGVYNVIYTCFDRSGFRITPRSKKMWFNADGELKNTTGDLIMPELLQINDGIKTHKKQKR